MKAVAVMLFLLVVQGMTLQAASNVDFYVNPGGNDHWNGKAPRESGDNGPFATLTRAREAVRDLKRQDGLARPIIVEVGAGRYKLPETWLFTPEDSGTEMAPIIYRAAKGASPVISGGRAVKNWQVGADGRWTAQVAGLLKGIYPQQMTVNGERRYRSRLPKEGLYRIAGLAGAKASGPLEELWASGSSKFEYRKGDIDPSWRNLSDMTIVIQHFWIDEHMPIQAIDADTCTLISPGKTRCRLTESWGKDLARYYVDNVQEALSLPGEWYLEYGRMVPGT